MLKPVYVTAKPDQWARECALKIGVDELATPDDVPVPPPSVALVEGTTILGSMAVTYRTTLEDVTAFLSRFGR